MQATLAERDGGKRLFDILRSGDVLLVGWGATMKILRGTYGCSEIVVSLSRQSPIV